MTNTTADKNALLYGYEISLVDDGGPYVLTESEGYTFTTIEDAIEDARGFFDEIEDAEIVQVFAEPGNLVAGWSPSDGVLIF